MTKKALNFTLILILLTALTAISFAEYYHIQSEKDLIIAIGEKLNLPTHDLDQTVKALEEREIKPQERDWEMNRALTPALIKGLLKNIEGKTSLVEVTKFLRKLQSEKCWTIAVPMEP